MQMLDLRLRQGADEDSSRLCYVRSPGGIIVALAEQLS